VPVVLDKSVKPVVLFGTTMLSRLVAHYLRQAGRTIAAYTVDLPLSDSHEGLDLVAFDDLADRYPPSTHDLFVAVGNRDLNAVRDHTMDRAKKCGYDLASYVHPTAFVDESVSIGENCLILEACSLGPFSLVEDGALLFAGALVNHDCTIGRCAYLSAATLGGFVHVGPRTFLGIRAAVHDCVTIGSDCLVNAVLLLRQGRRLSRASPGPEQGVHLFGGGGAALTNCATELEIRQLPESEWVLYADLLNTLSGVLPCQSLSWLRMLREVVGGMPGILGAFEGGVLKGALPYCLSADRGGGTILNSLPFFGSNGSVLAAEEYFRVFRRMRGAPCQCLRPHCRAAPLQKCDHNCKSFHQGAGRASRCLCP